MGEPRKRKPRKRKPPIRLNLGGGINPIKGYENWDRSNGHEAFPLGVEPGTVDEIRASHILEHFSHTQTLAVVQDWVKALKPGGKLRVAVPSFDAIVDMYLKDSNEPIEGWLMGDHTSNDMSHGAIFNRAKLMMLMKSAGLVKVRGWASTHEDCADLPISLNLEGIKPKRRAGRPPSILPLNIAACMSMPRLSFTDNYFCAFQALTADKIPLRKHTGAYWGQCLTGCILQTLDEFPDLDAILTVDYDSIFERSDVLDLVDLMIEHPEADAIAALQVHRTRPTPLMTINGKDGLPLARIKGSAFTPDITKVATAHFGLTLIRVDKLKKLPKPWFTGTADPNGEWGEGRVDADIHFWRIWEKARNSLYLANRVPIGHAELMIRWPGRDMMATYQHSNEFWSDGKPKGIWV